MMPVANSTKLILKICKSAVCCKFVSNLERQYQCVRGEKWQRYSCGPSEECAGLCTQRIALELNDHTRGVDVRALVEGVSASVRPDRGGTADAQGDNAQCDRGEYEDCSKDFFHRF
jgi:hypothetical protein